MSGFDYETGYNSYKNLYYITGVRERLLSMDNIDNLTQRIYTKVRSEGDVVDIRIVRNIVAKQLIKYVNSIPDYASRDQYSLVIDNANDVFVRKFPTSLVNKYVDINDEHQSTDVTINNTKHDEFYKNEHMRLDWNPMRVPRNGKYTSIETPDDIRNIDAWSPNAINVDDRTRRTNTGVKGLNNPYIVGAHKRHYERDITEGFRTVRELEPTKNRGYNNHFLYSTIGSNNLPNWEC